MSAAEQLLADNNVKISELVKEVQRWRDSSAGLNSIYPTITEGRQSVADGEYFSVPGNGAYMRLYRRQGSSAELIAEFPDVATLNGLIAQLGPLVGRGVVGGAGDLLAESAYGINGNGHDVDFNETPGGCFFRSVTEGGNVNGEPSIASGTFSGFLSRGTNSNHAVQIGAYTAGGDGGAGHLYWRKRWQSGLTSYKKIYDVSNILGTVSQSGGVPTGAIIDRGSNGFGKWTKFANGLRIQSTNRLSVDMSVTGSANIDYVLPQHVSGGATACVTAEVFSPGVSSFTRVATRVAANILGVRFFDREGGGNPDFGFHATVFDYWY